jgi:hypothetical protein
LAPYTGSDERRQSAGGTGSFTAGGKAAGRGGGGVGAITPYFYAYDDEALRRHYLTLAGAMA